MKNLLLDLKVGDIIEALDDLLLHLANCCCVPCHVKTEFCHVSILFNEVQLTVVLGIKITVMPMRLDQLLKLRPLRDKIKLLKMDVSATTVDMARRAMKT